MVSPRPGCIHVLLFVRVIDFAEMEPFYYQRRLMEQVQVRGTHENREVTPWESYASEMESRVSPELAAAIAEYAKTKQDEKPSNQALEELHFQREMSNDLAKQYQWLTPEEYAEVEDRIGIVMHSSEFITKLRSTGLQCWYQEHPHPDKAILIVQKGSSPREVGCWVQQGQMPELSIMRFDSHGAPLNEKRRGWRTCLLQLILKGFLTEEQANKAFGKPRQTQAFDRYNTTLFNWRKTQFKFE